MKATEQRNKRRWRSYYGAEQKSLHVKMYFDVLDNLDKEAAVDGTPRNALINQACEYYISQLDEERMQSVTTAALRCTPTPDAKGWVSAELTAGRYEQLEFIAKSMGCDVDRAAELLLERAIKEYNGRPFSFL